MTRAEQVIDASVIGAAFFNEKGSSTARAFLMDGPALIAPDLLLVEIASIAAKKVWREEAGIEVGRRAIVSIPDFVAEIVDSGPLVERAFDLAATHRFSAYDALYLSLAEARQTVLVTLDHKLADRAEVVGLGSLITRVKL